MAHKDASVSQDYPHRSWRSQETMFGPSICSLLPGPREHWWKKVGFFEEIECREEGEGEVSNHKSDSRPRLRDTRKAKGKKAAGKSMRVHFEDGVWENDGEKSYKSEHPDTLDPDDEPRLHLGASNYSESSDDDGSGTTAKRETGSLLQSSLRGKLNRGINPQLEARMSRWGMRETKMAISRMRRLRQMRAISRTTTCMLTLILSLPPAASK